MSRIGYIQSDLDLKFLVLYIMNRVAAPITFLQLLDLALCDEGVDYFSLTQAVGHLVATEHLAQDGQLYSITEKGRRNCLICESSLPYSVRRRCDKNLVGINEQLRRDAQIQGELITNEDETYTVRISLSDGKGPLLRLELLTPSQAQGQHLVERFKAHPEQFYNGVVNALFEDLDDTAKE